MEKTQKHLSFHKRSLRVQFLALAFFLISTSIYSHEALKSVEEEYYDFLALQGLVERPTLNYRTLSDSVWGIDESAAHPWQGLNLGTKRHLFGDIYLRIYGPELFTSYNTAAPYGQNDGALWQGKGVDTETTITLSSLLKNEKESPVFIKMDIEGYETSVIEASKEFLLERQNIRIACCTYHRQNDADTLTRIFSDLHYEIEYSDGYMLFIYDELKAPYFRKGIIRATKG